MNYDYEQRAHGSEVEGTYNSSFHKLMRMFTISILISFIGTFVGIRFVPAEMILPLVIVELGMLIAAFFIRRKGRPVGYSFVYTFCFISGITLYPAIAHYTTMHGSGIVLQAFVLTVAIFAGLTLYAYVSKRDFSFLGGFLMVGLLALIGLSIIGMFTGGFGGPLGLGIAFAGILIFSGFILYDISQYKHGVPDEFIPLAVLNLYLNFINLFLYLLQLLGILNDD